MTPRIPSQPSTDRATEKLIAALEATRARLMIHAQDEHRFRYAIFAEQEPGADPTAKAAEVRTLAYNAAKPASELRALPKIAAVVGIELTEATIAGLKEGRIIVAHSTMRGLIERTAHAFATAAKLGKIKEAPVDGPINPIFEVSDLVHKALFGTHREWTKVIESDFRTTSVKDLQYVIKPGVVDLRADNILKAIDRLDRTVAGTRLAYEILCEFLHPNVGDLWGATLGGDSALDAHEIRHVTRYIGLGAKTYSGLPGQQILLDKLYNVCGDIVVKLPMALDEIASIAERATRLTRRFAHGFVKDHRQHFAGNGPCPCLSGKTLAACTGLRDRREVEP